jgi:SM-20-related protein
MDVMPHADPRRSRPAETFAPQGRRNPPSSDVPQRLDPFVRSRQMNQIVAPVRAPVLVARDNFLPPDEHRALWEYLSGEGWAFGAYSDAEGPRYFYKHFAGFRQKDGEYADPEAIEAELAAYPLVAAAWKRVKEGLFAGHRLSRCYANAMPPGIEGGVHQDSTIDSHLTAIYYPHLAWDPSRGGETLFFNPDGSDVIGVGYPKPNRLVVFSGTVPHVARPLSARAKDLRITLMFKTLGPAD